MNLFGFIAKEKLYIYLNIIGAGLSCYASVLIGYWPFVVLEGCWVLDLRQSCVPRFSSFLTFASLGYYLGLVRKKSVPVG